VRGGDAALWGGLVNYYYQRHCSAKTGEKGTLTITTDVLLMLLFHCTASVMAVGTDGDRLT